mgnify:FL=1
MNSTKTDQRDDYLKSDYALRVAMGNAEAAPNADFRDKGELFRDPFERTIFVIHKGLTTRKRGMLMGYLSDYLSYPLTLWLQPLN